MRHSKIHLAMLVVCLLGALSTLAIYGEVRADNQSENTPFRIIVKVKSGIALSLTEDKAGHKISGIRSLDEVSARFSLVSQRFLFPEAIRGRLTSSLQNVLIITPTQKADVGALVEEYRKCPEVVYAEPDGILELYSSPNDPHYVHQWYLHNTAQDHYMIDEREPCNNDDTLIWGAGVDDADIDADEVYNNPPANTTTSIVAILDTGVDTDHPDLADNIWVNIDEIPDNGIDDDRNGYVDDTKGWDFQGETGYSPDNDPTDVHGHGTHCAGIVAAVTGNNQGVAGAADDVQIMALRAISPLPLSSFVAEALVYAVDNDADVINLSFGLVEHSDLFNSTCQFAYDRGVTLVAATGNSGIEEYNEPASYPTTVAVGATDHLDHVTLYSTYGTHLSVVAPGDDILSLRADFTDMYGDNPFCPETDAHVFEDIYYFSSGTSMAGPVVSAIASYLHAVSPGLSPALTQQLIEEAADDYTEPYGPDGDTGLVGWDIFSGWGRVNLNRALQNAPATRVHIITPQNGGLHTGIIQIIGIADWDGLSSYTVEFGEGDMPDSYVEIGTYYTPVPMGVLATWDTDTLGGRFTVRLRVGDDHVDCVSLNISNGCVAEIDSPSEGAEINSLTDIIGSGYCETGLDSIVLEYGRTDPIIFGPGYGEVINSLTAPVFENILGTWYSHDLKPGSYALRTAVYYNDVMAAADTITVNMIPHFADDNSYRVMADEFVSPVANYGDFDFDGIHELVVGTLNGLEFFRPSGEPVTQGMPETPAGNFVIPAAVGDINGDGLDDLVTAGGVPGAIYAFPSNETPFTIALPIDFDDLGQVTYEAEADFNIIILEDIDVDSRDEIVVSLATSPDEPKLIGVYDDDGKELWSSITSGSRRTILPADLNGDNSFEIYTFDWGDEYIWQRNHDGAIINSVDIRFENSPVRIGNITAFDLDYDGIAEIVLTCSSSNSDYYHYHALKYDLSEVAGWPHESAIERWNEPNNPVFMDLNGDGVFEYFVAVQSLEQSYIYAWHVDGSPFLSGSGGLFYRTTEPGMINMLCAADIDGIGNPELVAIVNPDLFRSNRLQRMMVWDDNGDVLDGFPKITGMVNEFGPDMLNEAVYRSTPTIGDLDEDGIIDLFAPVVDSEVVFTEFAGVSFNHAKALVPSWRYDRGFTANGPVIKAEITAPVDNEVIAGNYDVTGTASGFYFDEYTLEYGEGSDPSSWELIISSSNPVVDGVLGIWNTTALEGNYSLRLQTQENQFVTRNVFVANAPVASIISPLDNDTIWGIQETILPIIVSAMCVDFEYAIVEYGQGLSPTEWFTIETVDIPVYESEIAQWTASDLDIGSYTLRLSVYSTSGPEAVDEIVIHRQQYFAGDNGWMAGLNGDGGTTANYGDFDGDDINEIIIGTSEGVYFYDLSGNPVTTGMPSFTPGDYRIPAAVGLLDGDTKDDFVILGISGSEATLYGVLSQDADFSVVLQTMPNMGYFVPQGYNPSFMPQLYLRDIDGDGRDEIHYFTGGGDGSTEAKYYIYRSDGTPWIPFFPLEATVYDFQAFAADINGDGLCEIYSSGISTEGHLLKQYDISGNLTNTYEFESSAIPTNYSTVDINDDGKCELLCHDISAPGRLFAFDGTLGLIAGWPIDIPCSYVQNPVLADLDGDGSLEILAVCNLTTSKVMAWNLDGTSYVPGADGLFTIPANPGILYVPVVTDADADGFADVILAANRNSSNTYYAERLLAYDGSAELVAGYPIFTSTDTRPYNRNLHVPIVGDIDQDGTLDFVYVSAEQKLVFTDFSDRPYDQELTQIPMWRYNRRLNNFVEPKAWLCGDVNSDFVINSYDLDYLIAFLYQQGPPPVPLQSGDVNGDCTINILDLTYLIRYLNYGGPDPLCDCDSVSGAGKMSVAGPDIGKKLGSVSCRENEGVYAIIVDSRVPLSVLHLGVSGEGNTELSSSISGMQVWGTIANGESSIGIFDPTGKANIDKGRSVVLTASDELDIRSAFACDSEGNPVSLAVSTMNAGSGLPEDYALGQNYPNPFNPSTTICHELPQACWVRLEIFNLLGQRVSTLVDERQEAGRYQTVWDGRDDKGNMVSSGIYFYKLTADSQIKMRKMILIK